MKHQIIETDLKELTDLQYHTLRGMTLREDSMMRELLDTGWGKNSIPVAIAISSAEQLVSADHDWLTPSGVYLGWTLVTDYHPWDRKYVQVYVKSQYRSNGIGRSLVNHMRDRYQALGLKSRNDLYCYRWDTISQLFYNSLNMTDVYAGGAVAKDLGPPSWAIDKTTNAE